MDPDVTDPMSTQYPSTNATSAVTVASPALHNYSTVSNHPGIALSTHHHSHLPEPPGYDTSQWYSATTNHPPLLPFGMPRMLSYPRYTSVTNASGHGMIQGYPTAYGPQYSEPRYLPPGVVPPTYGGHVPYNYHNVPPNWYPQANSFSDMNLWYARNSETPAPMSNDLHYTAYEYAPPFYYHPQNALYGNEVMYPPPFIPTAPLQFRGQFSERPINTSHHPPTQRETIPPTPPAVAIDTNLACTVSTSCSKQSSEYSSPQHNYQSKEDSEVNVHTLSLTLNKKSPEENPLPNTPIVSLHNDLSVISSPATKRLRLTDSLEQQPGPSVSTTSTLTVQGDINYRDTRKRCSQLPAPSVENLDFLFEKLYRVCPKWYDFGLALGLMAFNLEQISIVNREKCQDCLRETLLARVRKRQLTWSEILKALRNNTVNENALATEIESEMVAIDSPTQQAPNNFSGKISLKELCLLPVDKVWYQLGLWLGVEEQRLIKIKKKDKKLNLLFGAFLELPYETTNYKRLFKRSPNDQKEEARILLESEKYEDFINVFPLNKQVDARKLVEMSKSLFPRLMTALVKVGNREMAENICSSRGKPLKPMRLPL